jgi:hypothetical protein
VINRSAIGVIAASCVVAAPGVRTAAEPVRLLLVARVQNVYDPGATLMDALQAGDLLRGTVTYDPQARDVDPAPSVGRYEHHQAPFGMSIEGGPFVFQTDPRRVDFSIVVSNDSGVPPRDRFLVTSRNNLPLPDGSEVSRMTWELVDDTQKALGSDALPLTAPDLSRWQSDFGLTIEGRATVDFIIRAHVIEAVLCTPGMRCPSPR